MMQKSTYNFAHVALTFAMLLYGEVASIYMREDVYPLQIIPLLSVTTQINYTMWTPKNWTATPSLPNVPILQYNAYLLNTTSVQSFRVLVPFLSSKSFTARSSVVRDKNNAIRIESNFVTTKPLIGCRLRHGSTESRHTNTTSAHGNCYHHTNVLLQRTTIQSKNHHCKYAMNGGPFNPNGSSVGVVIVQNGTFISKDFGPNIGFGIATRSKSQNFTNDTTALVSQYWVIGRIDNITQARTLGIEQFVTGFDWLVYNYSNIASYRNNTTGATRASRSAVGITSNGTLMLLVTDGCEHCFFRQGMTLTEIADLLIYFGAQYAINMDGGSSSVMVDQSHTILNQPSCYYNAVIPRTWVSCERSVSSVICIS